MIRDWHFESLSFGFKSHGMIFGFRKLISVQEIIRCDWQIVTLRTLLNKLYIHRQNLFIYPLDYAAKHENSQNKHRTCFNRIYGNVSYLQSKPLKDRESNQNFNVVTTCCFLPFLVSTNRFCCLEKQKQENLMSPRFWTPAGNFIHFSVVLRLLLQRIEKPYAVSYEKKLRNKFMCIIFFRIMFAAESAGSQYQLHGTEEAGR